MSVLCDTASLSVQESSSRFAFTRSGTEDWPRWNRFLTVDGEAAYQLGNQCDTCIFFFERLAGANGSIQVGSIGDRLRAGITELDQPLLDAVATGLPLGEYWCLLLDLEPRLVQPGSADDYFANEQDALWDSHSAGEQPHDPHTDYYRTNPLVLGARRCLYEFLVPMSTRNGLDPGTVDLFRERFAAGERPTALAVSVLDVKGPADWEGDPDVTEHWCLAHYLLDGHHKMLAAAQSGATLSLLSLLAVEQGISRTEQVDEALAAIRRPPS